MPLLFEPVLALSLLVFSGLSFAGETHALASPTLNADTEIATAGYFRLSWTIPALQAPIDFELQQSATADFSPHRTLYTGPDRATTFSGLANGDYYFRVRSLISNQPSSWSAVSKIQIQHHSLAHGCSSRWVPLYSWRHWRWYCAVRQKDMTHEHATTRQL